ncbi:hypothetical protein BRAO285_2630005 [Bradyrhizobium sp. ORS 285]|nr:hypothetical protein BRAO285_2630005 [Bradyrhizobium sp. ORS 285]
MVLPRAFLLHADRGCGQHPAFLAPSHLKRTPIAAELGPIRPRDRGGMGVSKAAMSASLFDRVHWDQRAGLG